MPASQGEEQRFLARVERDERGGCYIPLPFDPNAAWGEKNRHHVSGTIDGRSWRGPVERMGEAFVISLGPAWVRDCGLDQKTGVTIALSPEGPQRRDLAPDIVLALDAEPEAGNFFFSLATFYRKGYLRWIDATKRSPEVRAQRIRELVELLKAGHKQRPEPRRKRRRPLEE
ncbi:MAG TPA: YdeI/OmpD-associated family protein [Polyangiaceae bacterium]